MIRSFADNETERFFSVGRSRRLPTEILTRASMRLTQLDAATRIEDLLPPIHPGMFLTETLHELHVSQAQFARAIGVSPMRISQVVNGARPVTAELALLFGRALGQSPQYWLNLQAAYDLKTAEAAISKQLQAVTELAPA